jgi:4-amino-4-deoxy-L-arabinose transferase-like glycosyltransferase
MSAISLTIRSELDATAKPNRVVIPRRISTQVWRTWLLGLAVWSATLAALISLYVHPAPRIHDEFSYLLAADTLLHGRLSNPTPPAWEALQSFHTIMQPSYASKYPVGAGLLVAIGWMVLGSPLASSWLAAALLAVCVTWMIAGVLPKRWAILGGAMVSLSPFIQLAWSQSLLHGFLPACGSALLTGGILRLRRRVEFWSGLASGCGVGLLAISRPFEGLCCTAICAMLLWFAWSRHSLLVRSKMTIQAGVFAAAPVLAALILIAVHNYAVTGNWRHMPYQLHEAQYSVAPIFVFDSPKMENTTPRGDLPAVMYQYHAVDALNWDRERVGLKGWLKGLNEVV